MKTALDEDGNIQVTWSPADGAESYVIHYGDPGQTTNDAKFMGYSETNSWTLAAADVPTHVVGDKIYFYAQSFKEKGVGSNDIEKAKYLNEGEFLGSEWSKVASVTFE